MNGGRASRPSSFYQRTCFLTDSMWAIMEACWEHDTERRPTAAQIVQMLPCGSLADAQPRSDWGDLSSSSFRTFHNKHGCQRGYDASVVETLQILETNIAHMAGGSHDSRSPNSINTCESMAVARSAVSPPTPPLESAYDLRTRPILASPDPDTHKASQTAAPANTRHRPSFHSSVSAGQRRLRHEDTETDSDVNFISDNNNDSELEKNLMNKASPTPLASSPENMQEMHLLSTRKTTTQDMLRGIIARISSVFCDDRQYELFLRSQRSNSQMQALLNLSQQVLGNILCISPSRSYLLPFAATGHSA
jgi:hypothetical protein